MNGRGRGVSPDGALPASGRMHAPVPSTSPSIATVGGGLQFFLLCRCPCVGRWRLLPESKTHVSHCLLVP